MAKKEKTAKEVKTEETAVQEEQVKDPCAELQEQLKAQQDQYLRLAAEYDNYRKRTAKEKESIYADAKLDTLRGMLSVYDNLERGLAQYEEDSPHRKGLEMIFQEFQECLSKLGVEEIEALGKPFNPDEHNAVMHIDDESVAENTVVEVFQRGFRLGDKILRFAIVKVAN